MPRNPREVPCRSQFLGQIEAPLPMTWDPIIVPVPGAINPFPPHARFLGKWSMDGR